MRKIIQITNTYVGEHCNQCPFVILHALCDDNTIWERCEGTWTKLPSIPEEK